MDGRIFRRFIAPALATATLICATSALADWRTEYGGIVATTSDETVWFSCVPENVGVSGSTFEVFLNAPIPSFENPSLTFEFDTGETFEWKNNYGGDLYIGPMMGINNNDDKIIGYSASIRFGSHRAAVGSWISLAERFMKNKSVTIVMNGVKHGPVSLKGSSKALRNIAYLRRPCKGV